MAGRGGGRGGVRGAAWRTPLGHNNRCRPLWLGLGVWGCRLNTKTRVVYVHVVLPDLEKAHNPYLRHVTPVDTANQSTKQRVSVPRGISGLRSPFQGHEFWKRVWAT